MRFLFKYEFNLFRGHQTTVTHRVSVSGAEEDSLDHPGNSPPEIAVAAQLHHLLKAFNSGYLTL